MCICFNSIYQDCAMLLGWFDCPSPGLYTVLDGNFDACMYWLYTVLDGDRNTHPQPIDPWTCTYIA